MGSNTNANATCAAFLFNCPACGRHYKNSDRVPACLDCGTDLHCGKPPIPGYKFCEFHGGPAPSRNFYGKGRGPVSGENSQFALTRLASTYLKQVSDGRLLSNKAGINVLDQRITELLDRMGNGLYPDQLAVLRDLWEEYKKLGDSLDGQKVKRQLDHHFEAIYHDYMAFNQVLSSLEQRRKMAESEAKILKDIHAIITAEDAYQLTAKLLAAMITSVQQEPDIKPEVKSHLLKRVQYEFTRIIGEGSGEEPGRGFGEVVDSGSSDVD